MLPELVRREGDGGRDAEAESDSASSSSADALGLRCAAYVFSTAPEAVELRVDVRGCVVSFSSTFALRLGRSAEELIGCPLSKWLDAAGCRWVVAATTVLQGPVLLKFVDDLGRSFAVRMASARAGDIIVLAGLIAESSELEAQLDLHAVNNRLAVASRELARQRRLQAGLASRACSRQEELQAAVVSIERLARRDPLTGLANRRVLDDELPRLMEANARDQRPLSVLVIDLDHFKQVNDTLGHDVGDKLLASVALAMRVCIRNDDMTVRLGGDELMVVLPGAGLERALVLAEGLRVRIAELRVASASVTASIGVAAWTDPRESFAALMARADDAMYRAKAGGRNRCVEADGFVSEANVAATSPFEEPLAAEGRAGAELRDHELQARSVSGPSGTVG